MSPTTTEPNDFAGLFPESPQWTPELVSLEFADGNPNDYQSALTVPVEDFPLYLAAPDLAKALRELVDWGEDNVPYGIPMELLEKCCAAIAKAHGK
jgi:hypothetical protein